MSQASIWSTAKLLVPESDRVDVVLVGTGNMGMKHANTLIRYPWARLVAIADLFQDTAEDALARLRAANPQWMEPCRVFGRPRAEVEASSEDWLVLGEGLVNDVFDATDARAMVLAGPSDTHLPYARVARRRGRSVAVEKPMCNRLSDALELAQVDAEATDGMMMVLYHWLWAFAGGELPLINDKAGLLELISIWWLRSHGVPPGETFKTVGVVPDVVSHLMALGCWIMSQQNGGIWPQWKWLTAHYGYDEADPRSNDFGPYDPAQRTGENWGYGTIRFRDRRTLRWDGGHLAPVHDPESVGISGKGVGRSGFRQQFGTALTAQSSYRMEFNYEESGRLWVAVPSDRPRTEADCLRYELEHFVHLVAGMGPECCAYNGIDTPVQVTAAQAGSLHDVFASSREASDADEPVHRGPAANLIVS